MTWLRTLIFPIGLLAAAGLAALLGRPVLAAGLVGTLILILVLLAWEQFRRRTRRGRSAGYAYVFIEPDGTARELTAAERAYFDTEFAFGDGAAPYVKPWYSHVNPRGDLGGFLRRRQVPRNVPIRGADGSDQHESS